MLIYRVFLVLIKFKFIFKVSSTIENVQAKTLKSREIIHTKEKRIEGIIEKTKKTINRQKVDSSTLSDPMSEALQQNKKSLNILHSGIIKELTFDDVNQIYSDHMKSIGQDLRRSGKD
jgi:hypothetical protein